MEQTGGGALLAETLGPIDSSSGGERARGEEAGLPLAHMAPQGPLGGGHNKLSR